MSYVTQQQLIDAFGEEELIQLTDNDQIGVINEAVLTAAIVTASQRIDGYISPRYALPLDQSAIDASSLPEMAGYIVLKILYKTAATEPVQADYKDAISWLRDIQAGRVSLGEQDSGAADTGRIVAGGGNSSIDWEAY